MHPNVGPFIGKQLIQKLVTGDPSPQYVARVAAVFNDNGAGRARRPEGRRARDPARSRGARRVEARPGLRQAARAGAVHDGRGARASNATTDGVVLRRADRRAGPDLFYRAVGVQLLPAGLRRARHDAARARVRDPELEHGDQPRQLRQHARVRRRSRRSRRCPGATGTQPDWSALAGGRGRRRRAGRQARRAAAARHDVARRCERRSLPAVNAVAGDRSADARARPRSTSSSPRPQYQVER